MAICLAAALAAIQPAAAATQTWSGGSSNAWATGENWSGGAAPGATSGTTSTDYAVFNTSPSNRSPTWTTYLNLAGFTSGSGAGVYTIGTTSGSSAFLTSGGTTSIAVGVANSQTINAPLVILNASGSNSGSYTFLNSTTTNNTRLVLGGAISGQATAGGTTSITFTANRPSTSNSNTLDAITGAISDGSAGGKLALTKSGSSVLILTGSNSYTGGTTITDAGSMLVFGGTTSLPATGTVTVAAGSGIGLRVGGSGFTATDIGNLFAGTMANVSNNATSNVGIDTANGDFTYASSIAGTRGLVKLGTNKLTLSASNSFSGGASLLQGTVELGNAAALGSGTVTLFGQLQASTPLTGANKVMNPLVIAGAQASWAQTTINSTNDIEFGGPMTWSPGNTVFFTGAGTVTFSGSVTLTTASGWGTGGGQSNVTISGPISGNQNLSWSNDATMTLSGSNSFSGSLNASGSSPVNTISFSSANAVNSSSNIRFVGGRLLYTGTGDTVTSPMTLGVGSTTTGTATLDQSGTGLLIYSGSFTTGGNTAGMQGKFVLQGSTSGTGQINNSLPSTPNVTVSLDKQGTGTWILLGSNTYTGATTINAGTLQIGNSGTTGSLSGSSAISGSAGGTLAFNRSNAVTQGTDFNSVIGGAISVAQIGAGTLTLSGSNTYTGGTLVAGSGQLRVASGAALGTGTITLQTANTGVNAVLYVTSSTAISNPIVLSQLNTNRNNITFDTTTSTLSGPITITGSGSGLNYLGNRFSGQRLAISGNITGTAYAGSLSFRTGTIDITGTINMPSASFDLNSGGTTIISSTGNVWKETIFTGTNNVLRLGANNAMATNAAVLFPGVSSSVGGIDLNGFSQSLAGIYMNGAGTTGAQIYSSASGTSTLTLAGLAQDRSSTVAIVDGTGGGKVALVMNSAGRTQTLASATSSYSGGTTIVSGTLAMGAANALGSTSGALAVNGGTLDLKGFGLTVGALSGSAGGMITSGSAGAVAFTASSASDSTFAGTIQNGSGTVSFTKSGAGTLALAGSNTYTGVTSINAGTLQIGNGSTSGAVSASSAISIGSGAMLAFNRSDDYGGNFANAISGSGGIKLLSGALTFSNANTYSGNTVISGSSRLVLGAAGSFANSPVIVVGDAGSTNAILDLTAKSGTFAIGGGQTLQGGGTIQLASVGVLDVQGTFAPGNSPGLFTYSGGTTLLSGTTIMEIFGTSRATLASHGSNPYYDAVDVINNGTLTFGGLLTLDITGSYADNTVFNLFTASGTGNSLTGNFSSISLSGSSIYSALTFTSGTANPKLWTSTSTAGGQSLAFDASLGTLVIVPEPGAIALAGIGIAVAAWATRRRK